MKPTASVSVLRRKVWHLLDLPDYCEEVIVLKADENKEIPLTDLRKGNNPHHPFILEVWLPEARQQCKKNWFLKFVRLCYIGLRPRSVRQRWAQGRRYRMNKRVTNVYKQKKIDVLVLFAYTGPIGLAAPLGMREALAAMSMIHCTSFLCACP